MPKGPHPRKRAIERLIKKSFKCSLQLTFPRRKTNEPAKTTPAFVFDIDGVLYNRRHPLPGATEALRYLQAKNIPFVFLTNRWGESDVEGAAWIEETLDVSGIAPIQYIPGPAPFATLVPRFADQLVLFIGLKPARARFMAESFGYNNIITPDEIYAAYPDLYAGFVSPKVVSRRTGVIQIKAILVFDKPRKSEQDKVLITDLLLSENGVVGTRSLIAGSKYAKNLPNKGYQVDGQPGIWWGVANPFRRTLEEHFFSRTGRSMINNTTFGKPSCENFSIAEKHLLEWHRQLHGADAPKISTIWMVGDTINADIQGVNLYKVNSLCSWKSILVGTGVYRAGMLTERPKVYWPSMFSTGVGDGVRLALRQELRHHWWQCGGGDWHKEELVTM